ncbi:MAG: ribose 5-phosphate isomerase A [Candidatus Thermofonsia Clade 1 bacterium]|uniref:Ribose-5-phosphate isomerase A n=1 Tax=Candidatus Thermofonsia Clade 1 bacterium TaxID=2364210 RepID=A0A2M8PBP2_9CHLR|nr:MAG: ribose 5-phosphate isomerase A [Candidatus Thermofonsia Clade 1 bacterium]RMF51181.1 MAG: ribose-5-phosphate isomerase RpiA [Chloroflexota bacterium]
MSVDVDILKRRAAERAVELVESGMIVGLGSGSTASHALRRIAELIQAGKLQDIRGVPTSQRIEQEARALGIPLIDLDDVEIIDLTIDGADEVDPDLNLIKGGGGALLREKIVAQISRREIIVIDDSKLSHKLGTRWHLPVEVVPFGWRTQVRYLESLGAKVTLRQVEGAPFKTDQGNLILDCNFGPIDDPTDLARRIKARAGIVEHGLFLHMATEVIVASISGIRRITRSATRL